MTSNVQPSTQEYVQARRPTSVTIAAISMAIVGICAFINSYLILASGIFFGWLILGAIGFFTLVDGISLLSNVGWSYDGATTLCIINIFVGFIEIIGAYNFHFVVFGLVDVGIAIGVVTLVLSGTALYLLYRQAVRSYFGIYNY